MIKVRDSKTGKITKLSGAWYMESESGYCIGVKAFQGSRFDELVPCRSYDGNRVYVGVEDDMVMYEADEGYEIVYPHCVYCEMEKVVEQRYDYLGQPAGVMCDSCWQTSGLNPEN